MAPSSDRIDGWKAIGRHFDRDRSTVIRWARDRQLPVHAIPGGKTRTVYAFRTELDAWAQRTGIGTAADPVIPDEGEAGIADPPRRTSHRSLRVAAAIVAVLIAGLAAWSFLHHDAPVRGQAVALPADPATMALFVSGREDWGKRTRTSLARSVEELRQVTERDPGFAPAFAYLADAYLLEQEAGSMSATQAFERAAQAAEHARTLDPDLSAAQRALGFIAYWREGDRSMASDLFAQALRLDPDDAQTHFWFGNVLADNGQDAAALREFDKARLLDPGSADVAADLAWADWSAGRARRAVAELRAITAQHPENVEAHDCLSFILLAAGDADGFLREAHVRAALRGEPALNARMAALDRARAGGIAPLHAYLLQDELQAQADAPFPDHSLAAFYASLFGDRAALIAILKQADRQQERWGSAGYVRRIARRWQGDAAVMASLARRAAPPIAYTVS